jgi:hypothetical protein
LKHREHREHRDSGTEKGIGRMSNTVRERQASRFRPRAVQALWFFSNPLRPSASSALNLKTPRTRRTAEGSRGAPPDSNGDPHTWCPLCPGGEFNFFISVLSVFCVLSVCSVFETPLRPSASSALRFKMPRTWRTAEEPRRTQIAIPIPGVLRVLVVSSISLPLCSLCSVCPLCALCLNLLCVPPRPPR